MKTFLWIVVVANQLSLIAIGAVRFSQYSVSDFIFVKRLEKLTSEEVKLQKQIYKKLPEILVLQRIELIILGTTLVTLLVSIASSLLGIFYSLLSFGAIYLLSKVAFVQNKSKELFDRSLDVILKVVRALQPLFKLLHVGQRPQLQHISSSDEFKDTLRRLPSTVLSTHQRQKLETVLASEHKTIKECMTQRKQVTAVEPSATLGPIILSDLQKTGHGYFPVLASGGDVEGILRLADVSDIAAAKKRSTVSELLSPHMTWVDESASLEDAIKLFLSEKQYILLVNNELNEWSGIITVADLIKHTIGIHQASL